MEDKLKITWYGTAMIKLEINDEKILFDPFIRRNRRLSKPNWREFCPVDYMLNTHPHFDHLYDAPKILKKNHALLYGSTKMREILNTLGVNTDKRVKVVHPYDCIKTKETSIIVYPSKHSINDLTWKKNMIKDAIKNVHIKSLLQIYRVQKKFPMGNDIFAYKVKTKKYNILYLGSSGIGDNVNFQDSIDILILPYQGRTDIANVSHSLVEQINPKIVILTHFDDAIPPMTRQMNTEKFIKLMRRKRRDIKVILPQIGKSIRF